MRLLIYALVPPMIGATAYGLGLPVWVAAFGGVAWGAATVEPLLRELDLL